MLEKVENWLFHGRNYLSGVELYRALYKEDAFYRQFLKGENPYTKEELHRRLKKWFDAELQKKAKPVIVREKKKEKAPIYIKDDFPDLPDDLKTLASKLSGLYAELNHYRHSLPFLDQDSKRLAAAIEIKERLEPEIDRIYSELDYWKVHGKMKSETEKPYPSPLHQLKQWQQQLQRNREYISRNKMHLSPSIQENVRIKQIENKELKQLINGAI